MPAPVIALLTDFGTADAYVASMKGVILGICPDAAIVDVTHEIAPQNVPQAAFVLHTAYRYFPKDTIFVGVVDPGVGTQRRALAMQARDHRFVAPDNGLLTYLAREHLPHEASQTKLFAPHQVPLPPGWKAVALNRSAYWRQPVSATFHGRDVFAPVAAHLAQGVPLEEIGEPATTLTVLNVPQPVRGVGETLKGIVLHVDRFGNLATNIPGETVQGQSLRVQIDKATIEGLSATYGEGRGLVALVGSHGYLEIALVGGSAAKALGVGVGEGVEVEGK
ncbi:MAG: hypothetical protein EXR55_02345 [Dehalococcoidia bacterium]|nr:hypothetical protein [Dehalococcoidia bacterium]